MDAANLPLGSGTKWTQPTFPVENSGCRVPGLYLVAICPPLGHISYAHNVQKHVPEWLFVDPIQHWVSRSPTQANMCRSKPLEDWDSQVRNGHIKRITDQDIQSSVLEIVGTNVSTSFITCPANPEQTLAIKLPFLVMIIKNVSGCRAFVELPS